MNSITVTRAQQFNGQYKKGDGLQLGGLNNLFKKGNQKLHHER